MENCKPITDAHPCTAPNPRPGGVCSFFIESQSEWDIVTKQCDEGRISGGFGDGTSYATVRLPLEISPELMHLLNSKGITVDL